MCRAGGGAAPRAASLGYPAPGSGCLLAEMGFSSDPCPEEAQGLRTGAGETGNWPPAGTSLSSSSPTFPQDARATLQRPPPESPAQFGTDSWLPPRSCQRGAQEPASVTACWWMCAQGAPSSLSAAARAHLSRQLEPGTGPWLFCLVRPGRQLSHASLSQQPCGAHTRQALPLFRGHLFRGDGARADLCHQVVPTG